MKFLTLLLCLALERFLPVEASFQRFSWLERYLNSLVGYLPVSFTQEASAEIRLTVMVLPLWLLISSLCLISTMCFSNIVTFALELSVLLYCLGPLNPYRLALNTEYTVFEQAHEALLTPVFWFVLLGVPGVLLYRLLERAAMLQDSVVVDTKLVSIAQRLTAFLAWLPIRVFSFSYALVGVFSSTACYWLDHLLTGYEANHSLAANSGRIAIGLPERATLNADDYANALRLLDRILILVLVIVLLGSLATWI